MGYRDRATGWEHAKRSGHENEDLVKELLDTDADYAADFLHRIGCDRKKLIGTSIGGLHETKVESIIPGARKTKTKTDLKLFFEDGSQTNISIKKSFCGQVYFVRAGLFIDCFERQFHKAIPEEVKRAICLFWAGARDEAVAIIRQYGNREVQKDFDLQIRHQSLNATTLRAYDEKLYDALLQWFVDNAYELALLSFASGAVRDRLEWSEHVWYKNMLGENDVDEIFLIEDICKAAAQVAGKETYYGASNGGTTIQLPFGFVQWHQAQLQFHHNFDKVSSLLSR